LEEMAQILSEVFKRLDYMRLWEQHTADFDIRRSNSLGMTLVQTLVRQLRGELTINRENGTSFDITFSQLPSAALL